MLFEKSSAWYNRAIQGFWKHDGTSKLPLSETPVIDSLYQVELAGAHLKAGDVVNVEYLPPLAHFNGIETAHDLYGMRVLTGVVKKASPSNKNTEITLHVQRVVGLSNLLELAASDADDLQFWNGFNDLSRFYNIMKIDNFMVLSHAMDAYVGVTCILQRDVDDLFVLYCHEWADGWVDQISFGRVRVPKTLQIRIAKRLKAMRNQKNWSGHQI